ncbi:MAG: hypothetical protein AAF236_11275, partial [Verrucomicrobiota bacterium]
VGKAGLNLSVLLLVLALGHLSKQMMMVFPILTLIFLIARSETRPILKRPGIWLVSAGSYLALIPPLVWNARNEWITFTHTKHHFETKTGEGSIILERLEDTGSFVGSQIGLLSPFIGIALLWLGFVVLWRLRRSSREVWFLTVFGSIPVLAIFLLSLRQVVQPNWAAVFYFAAMILTAAWYSGSFATKTPPQIFRSPFVFRIAIATALAITAYFYFSPIIFAALGQDGHRADPNRRLIGYPRMVDGFQEIREQQPEWEDCFVVVAGHRDMASTTAFLAPDQPMVYHLSTLGYVNSQYDLWNTPEKDGRIGEDALILMPNDSYPTALEGAFERIEKVANYPVRWRYDLEVSYTVYRGYVLKKWPDLLGTDTSSESTL